MAATFQMASLLKVPHPAWSAGIGFAFSHLLQVYLKKSLQGSRVLSTWSGVKLSRLGISSPEPELAGWANMRVESRIVRARKMRMGAPSWRDDTNQVDDGGQE